MEARVVVGGGVGDVGGDETDRRPPAARDGGKKPKQKVASD